MSLETPQGERTEAVRDEWHLDKKFPIAMILAFVVQTFVLVYLISEWKTDTDNRLTSLEKEDGTRASHESRIIILEQSMSYIRNDLQEIKSILKAKYGNP